MPLFRRVARPEPKASATPHPAPPLREHCLVQRCFARVAPADDHGAGGDPHFIDPSARLRRVDFEFSSVWFCCHFESPPGLLQVLTNLLRAAMHAGMMAAAAGSTAMFTLGQHLIRDLLLLRRETGIKRFRGGDYFVQSRRALREALLLAFQPFDRAELRALGPLRARLMLRHTLLHALVHVARMLAHHVCERVPLSLLRIGNLQCRADIRKARFDTLARHPHMHAMCTGAVMGAAALLRGGGGRRRLRHNVGVFGALRGLREKGGCGKREGG